MNLKFNIDAAAIAEAFKDFAMEIEQDLEKGIANLALMTDAKVKELAGFQLHSSHKQYIDNLKLEEISPGLWVVSLDQPALWIEEGIPQEHDMKPDLLKNAKTSPTSGVRYKVIPFDHSKGPATLTPWAQLITGAIKHNLQKDKINIKKLEVNDDGSPKRGLLHTKSYGGLIPGKGNTPVMDRVSVYQTLKPDGSTRRDVFTFRTVTSDQNGKWIHPGIEAKKFLDKAFEWAMKEWEEKILPEILNKYSDE